MSDFEIRPLQHLELGDLRRLVVGYTSDAKYVVTHFEGDQAAEINMILSPLAQPYVKHYEEDEYLNAHYAEIVPNGNSFGAWVEGKLVGLAICEIVDWNNTLKVWEFHIEEAFHHQGIGRALMEKVIAHAQAEDVRVISCETQNTNVPAIRFYRAMGFHIGAIDLSLYENDDVQHGEVAIFMKYPLDEKS